MKLYFITICLLAFVLIASGKKFHKKHAEKKHSLTPQAYHLHNHYGASPYQSPYGPQPRLKKKIWKWKDADGKEDTKVEAWVDSMPVGYNSKLACDISQDLDFQFCFGISDCDICSASSKCGWCAARNTCLPGNAHHVACPNACFHGWIFSIDECTGKVSSGKITNIAPEATGLTEATYADPMAEIKTKIISPTIVKTPVLLGNEVVNTEVKNTNPLTGEVYNSTSYVHEKPITGVVHQILNVETDHKQYVNLKTGKRVAHENNKQSFGLNTQE